MIGYHVTTPRKVARYHATGAILPPVRFWPSEATARRWSKRTGRHLVLQIEVMTSYPLPDHRPARWSPDLVRRWKQVEPADAGEDRDED